jgi:hypothetical protein
MYPVESESLHTWMVKRLHSFGVYCLKVTLPLKERIIFPTATFSEGL